MPNFKTMKDLVTKKKIFGIFLICHRTVRFPLLTSEKTSNQSYVLGLYPPSFFYLQGTLKEHKPKV